MKLKPLLLRSRPLENLRVFEKSADTLTKNETDTQMVYENKKFLYLTL